MLPTTLPRPMYRLKRCRLDIPETKQRSLDALRWGPEFRIGLNSNRSIQTGLSYAPVSDEHGVSSDRSG